MSKTWLFFLCVYLRQLTTQDIRSMQMTLSNGQRFPCATTSCIPSIIMTKANILQCQIECLNQILCRAATFQPVNSQCQLFTDNTDTNMILEANPESVTMAVISGSRMPPEPASLSNSTTATTRTTTTTTTSSSSTTASSTSTSSRSSTTSTSSATTTTTAFTILTTTTEIVYAIWNTIPGGNSTPATAGNDMGTYSSTEIPNYVFDNNTATKYLNFGSCNSSQPISLACGINSGLYVTPQRGPSSLVNIQFCTANDVASRDPLTVKIEGSNQPSSSLTLGSSWTAIYNGFTGLQPIMIRNACGSTLFVSNNSNWYASYRVLVTSIRSADVATQYSELRMIGYQ